ncbi:hypothetical protein ACMHYB_00875 [Sorangium sp. So ce1128]
MITLYGFGSIFPEGVGETKDLRAQWALEETDLMEPFPRLKAYYERCQARPAWQRTHGLYAERLGVSVDDIR